MMRWSVQRAERKKWQKTFKVGDLVTWGNGMAEHPVVEVCETGVKVDVTYEQNADHFGKKQPDGRIFLFVSYDANNRNRSGRGPIRLAKMVPAKPVLCSVVR